MKRYLLSLLWFLFAAGAGAQQVIFDEDFESFSSYQIVGWGHQFSGPVSWQTGLPYLVGGACNNWPGSSRIAGIPEGCSIDHNNSNVLLITPQIDLTGHTNVWLRYDTYFRGHTNQGITETATVEITTDGGNSWDTLQQVGGDLSPVLRTLFLDISAYAGQSDVRIGFRYSDGGGYIKGWEIDNVLVFAPAQKDIWLTGITPTEPLLSYVAHGTGFRHEGTVFNYGLDTITGYTVKFKQGNGPVYSHTISGVQIPPFTYHDFSHPVRDTVSGPGTHQVTAWAETAGDTTHHNDTALTWLNGAYFVPDRLLTIEHGTGTWNDWAPRGIVLMNQTVDNDMNLCRIAAHESDPMAIQDYSDFLYYHGYNYAPYYLFDRRKSVHADSFFHEIQKMQLYFGYADLQLTGGLALDDLNVDVTVTPAIDLAGDLRLVLVVTEDSVTGSGSGYNQDNIWSGGALGTMGGFELKPNPVPASQMHYNFVARKVFPAADGAPAMLPPNLDHNTAYSYNFHTTVDPAWNKANLNAYVLLINNGDSTILNSRAVPITVDVADLASGITEPGVFPNPATERARIRFAVNAAQQLSWSLFDIGGRMVINSGPRNYGAGRNEIDLDVGGLQSGIYFFTLSGTGFRKTIKVQVLR